MALHHLREIDSSGMFVGDHPFWDDGAREAFAGIRKMVPFFEGAPEVIGVPLMVPASPASEAVPGVQAHIDIDGVMTPLWDSEKNPVWVTPPIDAVDAIPEHQATDDKGTLLWKIAPQAARPPVPEHRATDERGNQLWEVEPTEAIPANPIPANMIEVPVPEGFHHPRWDGSQWVEGKTPAELQAARTAARANQRCTMAQARLALLQTGRLDMVNAAIAAMIGPEGDAARIEWEFRTEVWRSSRFVAAIASLLGMTDEDMDALFALAQTL